MKVRANFHLAYEYSRDITISPFHAEFLTDAILEAYRSDPNSLKKLNQGERKIAKATLYALQKGKKGGIDATRSNTHMNFDVYMAKVKNLSNEHAKTNSRTKRFFKKIANVFHFRIGISSLEKIIKKMPASVEGQNSEIFKDLKNQGYNTKVLYLEKISRLLDTEGSNQEIYDHLYEDRGFAEAFVHANIGESAGEGVDGTVARMRNGIETVAKATEEFGAKAVFEAIITGYEPCFDGTMRAIRSKLYPNEDGRTIYMPKIDEGNTCFLRINYLFGAYVNTRIKELLVETNQSSEDSEVLAYLRNSDISSLEKKLSLKDFTAWCVQEEYVGEHSPDVFDPNLESDYRKIDVNDLGKCYQTVYGNIIG